MALCHAEFWILFSPFIMLIVKIYYYIMDGKRMNGFPARSEQRKKWQLYERSCRSTQIGGTINHSSIILIILSYT